MMELNNGQKKFTTLFIDLDDTVYPRASGLWDAIRDRIDLYMLEVMGFEREAIPALRRHLFSEYGTTMRGLQMVYGVDMYHYLEFVHDIPLADYIGPDPALRQAMQDLPQRKIIFTNADTNHARRVLNCVGIADCFEGIVDIIMLQPYCKPHEAAYEIALKKAGIEDPRQCVLADDSLANLAAARRMGLYTVRVGSREQSPDCDTGVELLKELPGILQAVED